MSTLNRQFAYFKKHQNEYAKEHHGEFVLIHNNSVEGFYQSELRAYTIAKNKFEAGTFLIRKCLRTQKKQACSSILGWLHNNERMIN